jgi:hypothetical protein
MRCFILLVSGLCAVLGLGGCAGVKPQPLPLAKSYLRVREATNGTVTLEVAVRTLAPTSGPGPVVRLVGVTHLGTSNYYAGLQRLLDPHPVILFEGVGATDKRFASQAQGEYSLQPALAKALGLRFQLQAVDYRGSNFINSDLSVPQLQRILATGPTPDGGKLGELMSVMDGSSWLGVFVRFGLNLIESNPRLQATVQLVLVETLGAVEGDLANSAALPADLRRLMEVLIVERNRTVVEDVRRWVREWNPRLRDRKARAAGLAVFYGAGHMVDLERRLREELGYRAVAEDWRPAFEVNPGAAGLSEFEIRFARSLVQEQLKALRSP